MTNAVGCRILPIALGAVLTKSTPVSTTGVMADEIAQVMQENLARRTYTMSLMAMVFLPSTFLTGLFGVNLGGIPGGGWQSGFSIFCILLVVLIGGVALWLHRSKWL